MCRRRYHPGAVALPASLAAAEAKGASGAELLTALAAGYEIGLRVGVCAGVSHSTSGYHVTGTVGAIGAAAAAARTLRLSPEQTAHALGIGATQAAGLYAARMGAMTKRLPTLVAHHRAACWRHSSPNKDSLAASTPSRRRSAAS